MKLSVDPSSAVPIYRQLVDSLSASIRSGEARAGEKLPPARDVAAALDVNVHTVLRAYQDLRDSGLVDLRRGRGAVVTDRAELPDHIESHLRELIAAARRAGLTDAELRAALDQALPIQDSHHSTTGDHQ